MRLDWYVSLRFFTFSMAYLPVHSSWFTWLRTLQSSYMYLLMTVILSVCPSVIHLGRVGRNPWKKTLPYFFCWPLLASVKVTALRWPFQAPLNPVIEALWYVWWCWLMRALGTLPFDRPSILQSMQLLCSLQVPMYPQAMRNVLLTPAPSLSLFIMLSSVFSTNSMVVKCWSVHWAVQSFLSPWLLCLCGLSMNLYGAPFLLKLWQWAYQFIGSDLQGCER